MAEFIWQVRNSRQNTLETVKLALDARQYLFQWAEDENIQFDLERRGILHICRTKNEFDGAAAANALLNKGGLERFAVTPKEMADIEPSLRGDYFAGFYTPSDTTGDIHKFTRGLANACETRGADLLCDSCVENIETHARGVMVQFRQGSAELHELEADAVVICAGVESRRIAASLGDRINIYPVKGYSISVHLDDERSSKAAPIVSLLDDERKIVTSRFGNRFRVAGTAEFNGFNRDIRDDRIRPLVDWTRECFPDVATDRVVPWSGLRPMTPNMLPRVGAGKRANVFYNTGHGHLGWTLAAATAHIIAAQIGRAFGLDIAHN